MIPVNDFRLYWLAAKALASGANPYAPVAGYTVVSLLHPGEALVPFNPPWAMPLFLPLAWLPYRVGAFLWLALSTGLIAVSAIWLAEVYGKTKFTALVAILVFPLILLQVMHGQIGAFLLFGLAGFLRYVERDQILAGAFLVLLAAKPQLLFLIWPALFVCALAGRWRPLAGFLMAVCSSTGLVLVLRPGIFADYFSMLRAHHVASYDTATLASLLAHWSGIPAMQYMLVIVGLLSLAATWNPARTWADRLPGLIMVSLAATPYAWPADYILLLPAFFYMAGKFRRKVSYEELDDLIPVRELE